MKVGKEFPEVQSERVLAKLALKYRGRTLQSAEAEYRLSRKHQTKDPIM